MSQPELLDGEDRYICPHCNGRSGGHGDESREIDGDDEGGVGLECGVRVHDDAQNGLPRRREEVRQVGG